MGAWSCLDSVSENGGGKRVWCPVCSLFGHVSLNLHHYWPMAHFWYKRILFLLQYNFSFQNQDFECLFFEREIVHVLMLACIGQGTARRPFSGRVLWIQVNKQKKVHRAFWQQDNFKAQMKKPPEPQNKPWCNSCCSVLLTDKWFLLSNEKYNMYMAWCVCPGVIYPSENKQAGWEVICAM